MSISNVEPEADDTLSPVQQQLRERVRSLRLAPSESGGGGGTSILRLAAMAAILTIVLGGAWMIYRGVARAVAKLSAANAETAATKGAKKEPEASSDDAAGPESEASPPEPQDAGRPTPSPGKGEKPSSANAAPRVAAIKAGSPVLESKGYILPVHTILVSPKISGMLTKVNIEEGMRVQKGDVLAVIEKTEYQADVARSEALVEATHQRWQELQTMRPEEIAAAKAEVEEAKAKLEEYIASWKRIQELFQKKVVTREQYDNERSNYETQLKRIDRLEQQYQLLLRGPRAEIREAALAQKRQAEADLVKAKWKLDNCEVVAPKGGTVLRKRAEEGNIVNPLAQQGSFSLCDLADLSDLEVELDIQERDVARIFDGQRCSITTIAYPKRVYDGFVSRLMPVADRGKGSVPARVKVIVPPDEEGIYLKPDMSAIVRFYADTSPLAPEAESAPKAETVSVATGAGPVAAAQPASQAAAEKTPASEPSLDKRSTQNQRSTKP